MADDQDASNEVGEETEVPTAHDQLETTTAAIIPDSGNPVVDDYVDEPIEDYVVKLVVNEAPDGVTISPDLAANALVTDINGNIISSKQSTLIDSINEYSTAAYNELNGNGTAITGSKRWWGWSTQKIIIFGLILLLILAIIAAILFIVLRKKFSKKKKGPTPSGTTVTTKSAVTKGIDPKYHTVQTA